MATQSPEEMALAALAPMLLNALGDTSGASLGGLFGAAKARLRDAVRQDPMDANLTFIVGASALFFLAEKDVNPKVATFFDALVYTTTCLSVGYSDIFAKSEAGKLVGSIIMTVGPALSGTFLDPPAAEVAADPNAQVQAAILARLDDILAEMKRTNAGPPGPG
jgi:voltage-gated potassium channel